MKFQLTAAVSAMLASSLLTMMMMMPASVTAQGTDLGNGVITRVDVGYLADLSLDVRDMRTFLQGPDGAPDALDIYNNGRNSEKRKGIKYALKNLNQELAREGSTGTPNYVYHLYGLADRSTEAGKLNVHALYADAYIKQLVQAGDTTYGHMSVIALSMWMYATHLLMDGFDVCSKMTLADNRGQFTLNGGGMDEFIALWIGNDPDNGLAGLAHAAAANFQPSNSDANNPEQETQVNKNIKLLYQQGAALLSVENACSKETPETPRELWNIAQQIISQMQIPIMQLLIDAIVQQDTNGVQLYGLAVIPQISQCRPSTFKKLNEELLVGTPNFSRTAAILEDLQSIYGCLGFTCDDIGKYVGVSTSGVQVPTCPNPLVQPAMAQYFPTSAVHPVSQIDVDVLQMRILTSLGRFRFAKHLYEYGRNSPVQRDSINDPFEYYSLGDFAVSTARKNADPMYTAFVQYHNDPNYADTMIRKALDGTDKWSGSIPQRTAVVAETAAFHVLFLHAVAQINDAVTACKGEQENDEYDLTHPWDEVAALLIGSLEGPKEGGSADVQDGQLIWGLANRRAFQFQTLNDKGYSSTDSRLEDLLFAGRGELDAENCDALEKTGEQIKSTILIPLLQSVIRYAIDNEDLNASSDAESLALGETYALAAIPIVAGLDESAASILEENMVVRPNIAVVRDGVQAVATAAGAAAEANSMRCTAIGTTSQADPCVGNGSGAVAGMAMSWSRMALTVAGGLVGAVLMMW
mmetsp:Transcript_6750/g.19755  ORF Transcript_6750/g.19755 Transcript_6750/m.19755 type:complete len:751 (-) Transcript_6750:154-2406(-)|eukprot:CAMPEP_0119565576 /NCGR_PEP_ID=MMETSP1352-20130426/30484_1 /TAXON_ID=265584 /ORGANISM="Stauroneis constricta, Strain CCMP1120" /LENGTH=750 /DNA_ID=CAMNT_0007614517 /DNA_START=293 /DNA_END=2545 /DNA_ORIENTATION=+